MMEDRETGLKQKKSIQVEMFLSSIKIESLSSCGTFGALLSLFLFFKTYFFLSPSFFLFGSISLLADKLWDVRIYSRRKQHFNLSLDGMNVATP
jgi:hypothetical protein